MAEADASRINATPARHTANLTELMQPLCNPSKHPEIRLPRREALIG
jgi:hypothetical protein